MMEEQHRRAAAEVIRICREQGRSISQMLAAYTVQGVLLQNMQKDGKLDDTTWEQCVRRGVELLSRVGSCSFCDYRTCTFLTGMIHSADLVIRSILMDMLYPWGCPKGPFLTTQ